MPFLVLILLSIGLVSIVGCIGRVIHAYLQLIFKNPDELKLVELMKAHAKAGSRTDALEEPLAASDANPEPINQQMITQFLLGIVNPTPFWNLQPEMTARESIRSLFPWSQRCLSKFAFDWLPKGYIPDLCFDAANHHPFFSIFFQSRISPISRISRIFIECFVWAAALMSARDSQTDNGCLIRIIRPPPAYWITDSFLLYGDKVFGGVLTSMTMTGIIAVLHWPLQTKDSRSRILRAILFSAQNLMCALLAMGIGIGVFVAITEVSDDWTKLLSVLNGRMIAYIQWFPMTLFLHLVWNGTSWPAEGAWCKAKRIYIAGEVKERSANCCGALAKAVALLFTAILWFHVLTVCRDSLSPAFFCPADATTSEAPGCFHYPKTLPGVPKAWCHTQGSYDLPPDLEFGCSALCKKMNSVTVHGVRVRSDRYVNATSGCAPAGTHIAGNVSFTRWLKDIEYRRHYECH